MESCAIFNRKAAKKLTRKLRSPGLHRTFSVNAFHAETCVFTKQVKRQCKGCGNGGDWAVKVDVTQQQPTDHPDSQAAPDATSLNKPRRVAVLFYIADEGGQQVVLRNQESEDNDSRMFSSGHHAEAGDWQMHVTSPGKTLSSLRDECVSVHFVHVACAHSTSNSMMQHESDRCRALVGS